MPSLPPITPSPRVEESTQGLPEGIKKDDMAEAYKPGPVYLPGVNIRNPISGRVRSYSNYPWSKSQNLSKVSPHHMKEHERSIFTHTTYGRNYFIIAPDWTSEGVGRRRITTKERNHSSWDSRPAVQPLSEFIIPLLERRASKAGVSVEQMYNSINSGADRDDYKY